MSYQKKRFEFRWRISEPRFQICMVGLSTTFLSPSCRALIFFKISAPDLTLSLMFFYFCSRKKMTFSARPTTAMLEKYTSPPTASNPHPSPSIGTIWVEFSSDLTIGIKQMRNFAQMVTQHNFHTGILVTQVAVSAPALKIIPVVLPAIIETFQEQDLLVNITHHELVPKHILMSPEEKKKLLERYRLKESQLPRIQTGDPVAKYLGLRRGQVVKIIRRSETAGRYASYRWAI